MCSINQTLLADNNEGGGHVCHICWHHIITSLMVNYQSLMGGHYHYISYLTSFLLIAIMKKSLNQKSSSTTVMIVFLSWVFLRSELDDRRVVDWFVNLLIGVVWITTLLFATSFDYNLAGDWLDINDISRPFEWNGSICFGRFLHAIFVAWQDKNCM